MTNNANLPRNFILSAVYRRPELPEYVGNPLLEALPKFVLAEDLLNAFPRLPLTTKDDHLMSKAERVLAVSRIYDYLELLPPHWDVIDQLGAAVRSGYVHRNPLNAEYHRALTRFYRDSTEDHIVPITLSAPSTAPSFALFGTSGVGKSSVVERSASFLPQVICHEQHGFIQIVWMKLDCPLDGGLKGLLLKFISEVDRIAGTRYSSLYNKNSTVDSLVLEMCKIAAMNHLGVIIIDEIQHLMDAPGVSQAKMLNFFVTLSNEVKIPVLTMGTIKAQGLLQGTFREARRVGENGCFIWEQLCMDAQWDYFLGELFQYQWTQKKANFSKEMSKAMFNCTQGIHGLVVRLFQLAQICAIRNNEQKITPRLVRVVAKEKFKLVQPMLDALKKKDVILIKKYDDLIRKNMNSVSEDVDYMARISVAREQKSRDKGNFSEMLRAVSLLVQLDVSESAARELIDREFTKNPKITAPAAVANIVAENFLDKS